MSEPGEAYAALITSWHRGKARFTETVRASVGPVAEVQTAIAGVGAAFDLDTAIGVQLDTLGGFIGRTREISYPVRGNYFALDDPDRGLDVGVWRGPFDTIIGAFTLEDERYRRLLKAKTIANRQDGTLPAAQDVLDAYFTDPETRVVIEDRTEAHTPETFFAFDIDGKGYDDALFEPHIFAFDTPDRGFDESRWLNPNESDGSRIALDMEITVTVSGKVPDAIDLAILANRLLPIKPAGVQMGTMVASTADAPLFGFDLDGESIGGFDRGAFGVTPQFLQAEAV